MTADSPGMSSMVLPDKKMLGPVHSLTVVMFYPLTGCLDYLQEHERVREFFKLRRVRPGNSPCEP